MNANMYYGNEVPNNQNQAVGYTYGSTHNNHNENRNQNSNQYLQVPQYSDQCNYPQTGLTAADADTSNSNTRTEFILPEGVKVGLIMLSICCFLCFFVLLIVK